MIPLRIDQMVLSMGDKLIYLGNQIFMKAQVNQAYLLVIGVKLTLKVLGVILNDFGQILCLSMIE